MSDTILEIHNLRKVYGSITAVEGLNFKVERGQIFGLLGPNGSGKTTTLGMLLGTLNATSGTFSWFNNGTKDENRKRIGSLLETPNFYPYMNAVDNLRIVALIKGMKDYDKAIEENLKRVNLWERRASKFSTYSLGMKQRLAIASSLLVNPEVLVLDEPTNGLDPMGIAAMRSLILDIAKEGKTIIIASHILDEVEKMCTHVAIMRKGHLLQCGKLDEIMAQDKLYLLKAVDMAGLHSAIGGISGVRVLEQIEQEILVSVDEITDPSGINRQLAEKGIYLSGLREHRKNLEETFIEIIQS